MLQIVMKYMVGKIATTNLPPACTTTHMYIYIYMQIHFTKQLRCGSKEAMANAREGVPSQQIGGLEKFSKISRLFGGSFKCKKKNMSKECIPTYLRLNYKTSLKIPN